MLRALLFGILLWPAHLVAGMPVDAPELAQRGPYAVGLQQINLTRKMDAGVMASLPPRDLEIVFWYPGSDEEQDHQYGIDLLGAQVLLPGRVAVAAPPVDGERFPLVVMSHGLGGRAVMNEPFGEALASRGYVVAAIDHGDFAGLTLEQGDQAFVRALLHRAADQKFVIGELRRLAEDESFALAGSYDPENMALIGYSMGGYGAVATSGGGYREEVFADLKFAIGLVSGSLAGQAGQAEGLKATILLAPWGGQTPYKVWSDAALQKVEVPTLVLVGREDDVVGYDDGVRALWQGLKSTDRILVTYDQARHNIASSKLPSQYIINQQMADFFEEPVWRKERLLAINTHFISAFLDAHLKGQIDRLNYLRPGDQGWPGFAPRWALGFEVERLGAGE